MPIMACRMPSTVTSRCLRLPHVTLGSTAALPENRSPKNCRRRCNAHLRGSRSSCSDLTNQYDVRCRLSGGVAQLKRSLPVSAAIARTCAVTVGERASCFQAQGAGETYRARRCMHELAAVPRRGRSRRRLRPRC
jgi:hypothetical protein